jgi:hypothetical protein
MTGDFSSAIAVLNPPTSLSRGHLLLQRRLKSIMSKQFFGTQSIEQKLSHLLKPLFHGSKKEFILINNLVKNWEEIIAKNSFYKIVHHVDFISKFVNLDWSFVKESLEQDYFQEFLRLFYEYVDKDWFFAMNFPDLVALFSLHFNLGKGCTQVSAGLNKRFYESYRYLSRKTTMLRRVDQVSEDFVLFITSEDLLKEKKYWDCNHIICVNKDHDGIVEEFFKKNGFEFGNYKNLVYDARKINVR